MRNSPASDDDSYELTGSVEREMDDMTLIFSDPALNEFTFAMRLSVLGLLGWAMSSVLRLPVMPAEGQRPLKDAAPQAASSRLSEPTRLGAASR